MQVLREPIVDPHFLLRTLQDLVSINSVNPSLSPLGPGEAEIADYVEHSLQRIGLETRRFESQPGRVSVAGFLRGSGGGRSLMLNAHYDTVGVEGMPEPFGANVRQGRLHGRGAYDMKGSMAACMAAAKALRDADVPLRGDLVVAGVADEEFASLGTLDILRELRVDAAIVTEPTELDICVAHKGFAWLEVETLGRAAHGSQFELGIDANLRMGRFLGRLEKLEERLRTGKRHPLLGPASLHAAKIQGGTELSMYAARCILQVERRLLPGETAADGRRELDDIVRELVAQDPAFDARVRTLLERNPFEVSPTCPIVTTLAEAALEILERPARFVGQNPWMDSALLSAAGIETVVMGPSGAGAHSSDEWVDLKSLEDLSRVLSLAALRFCGRHLHPET